MNAITLVYPGFLMNRATPLVMYMIIHTVLATSSETACRYVAPKTFGYETQNKAQLNGKAQK